MISTDQTSLLAIEWPPDPAGEGKRYHETTHRICTPEDTFERFAPRMEAAGITRLADITKLDIIRIPTYMATRPQVDTPEDNITVYNGKGVTKIQAKVSAMMEAFERHAAERHGRWALLGSYEEISRGRPAVHPRDLILPEDVYYADHETLEWVAGTDLFSGETVWVPAAAAFCPYVPQNGARGLGRIVSTNGLASGNSIAEAVNQGLAELIERDADALSRAHGCARTVPLEGIDSIQVQGLIGKFQDAGIRLVLKEITSDLGIAAFFAVCDDPETQNPVLLCGGYGCHPNREIAAIRAITEVAQSRCTFISGSREDLVDDDYKSDYDYHELLASMKYWYAAEPPFRRFQDVPHFQGENHVEDIRHMLAALKRQGLQRAVALNLTHPAVGVPVVKIVVPGLEENMEHCQRRGPRLKAIHASGRQTISERRPSWLKRWFAKARDM